VRPSFRILAWFLAVLVATGLVSMVVVLLDEAPEPRELAFFAALFVAMSVFLWACVRTALARETRQELLEQSRRTRWWHLLVAVYALSLLVVLGTMLTESGSWPAWAGLLLFANLAGCALFLFRRPILSGR
jgi:hypothetical protein